MTQCKVCGKKIKIRENGYNGIFQGHTFRDRKTSEVFSVCYSCMRRKKEEYQLQKKQKEVD